MLDGDNLRIGMSVMVILRKFVPGLLALAVPVAFFGGLLLAAPAQALVIGPGQTATVDFSFGTVAGGTPQPLTFNLEITTSGADPFDDSTGQLFIEYLDIGAGPGAILGYDATGGFTSLGIISASISTTDVTGSVRFGTLGESIDVTSVTLEIVDDLGDIAVETTSLTVPETVDAQLPAPGGVAALGLGLIALAAYRRRR